MKTTKILIIAAAVGSLIASLQPAVAQPYNPGSPGTAFSYEGKLNVGTNPATGSFDMKFALFDASTAGTQQGSTITNTAIGVTNGLFTLPLDFGNQFPGASRWLEFSVRTNNAPSYSTLSPREALLPTPYAIYASSASNVVGSIPASQISGTLALAQLPATVVTNGGNGVNFSGNLNLPALTASTGIIYAGGNLLEHGDGSGNFFVGLGAGNLTMSGGYNTGVGSQTLPSNTSGFNNTANGYLALNSNTSGINNTANGAYALNSNTSGSENTANGVNSL